MTPQFIQGVAFDALELILLVSAPVLIVALLVGLIMSIIQATTQLNEMTLAYIPKIVAVYATLIVAAGFIVNHLISFTNGIFSDFSRYVQ